MWMLRVHYKEFAEGNRLRNKELTGLGSYIHATIAMSEINQHGLNTRYATENFDEYWVAPSQIIGFEIIEYEGDEE